MTTIQARMPSQSARGIALPLHRVVDLFLQEVVQDGAMAVRKMSAASSNSSASASQRPSRRRTYSVASGGAFDEKKRGMARIAASTAAKPMSTAAVASTMAAR